MAPHDVLAGLTPAQAQAAVQSGPVLVLAGAETGKTKTLTAAVKHTYTYTYHDRIVISVRDGIRVWHGSYLRHLFVLQ